MNETGGNISLEDGKMAKDGNEIADCIEQFTGISISPPVKTIETALHNLQIAESEGETKEESVSNLGNGALPEQTPNSSKTPTSVESSKSDVTVTILEDGKASPDEESGSDHDRSKVSEGGQIEGRTLKEECKHDRDDAKVEQGEANLTPTSDDLEVTMQGHGPIDGFGSSYTRCPKPDNVSWPNVQRQPGVSVRRHHSNIYNPSQDTSDSDEPLKFVRLGSGVPVENEDGGLDSLEHELLKDLNQIPQEDELKNIESKLASNLTEIQLTTPYPDVQSPFGPACFMPLQGSRVVAGQSPGGHSNYSVNTSGTATDGFSEQGSSAGDASVYCPTPGASSYYSCTSPPQQPGMLQSPHQQFSPDNYSAATLSPYSDLTGITDQASYLGSPSSTDQGSPIGITTALPVDSPQVAEFANSPDSALGTEVDRYGGTQITEAQQIDQIAHSLEITAKAFEQQQQQQQRQQTGGVKSSKLEPAMPETLSEFIVSNSDAGTSNTMATTVGSGAVDVKRKLRQQIEQRRPSGGEKTGTKDHPKTSTGGNQSTEATTQQQNEATPRRRGRPPGRKNNPKALPKSSGQQPILPVMPPPHGPNVTSVIIISQGASDSQRPAGQGGGALVIPPPNMVTSAAVSTGYPRIMPKVEKQCNQVPSTVGPVKSQGPPLILQRPQTSYMVSEASDEPPEVEKKRALKAERTVAGIERHLLEYQDSDGDTLLHDLSLLNSDELLENLFDKPMSLLTIGVVKERHMFRALIDRMQREGILEKLIDMANKLDQTPLYLAVATNRPDLLQLLLDKGADPNKYAAIRSKIDRQPAGFRMPLHTAAEKGRDYKMVLEMLLRSPKIEVNIKNSDHRTPLHIAIDNHGSRPCQTAEPINNDETVRLLIQHGAKILKGPNERTPLHTLVERKDLEFLRKVVELLPAEQRDKALNATDSNGNTCLHLAAAHTSNKKNADALSVAILQTLLLVWEVDLSIKNNKSATAKTAVHKDNVQVLEIFREADTRRKNRNANLCYSRMTQPADSSKQSLGASCDQGNPIQGICNQGNPILGTGNQGNQFQCTGNQGNQFQGIGNQGNQIQGMGHQGNQSQAISNQGYSFPGNSNQGSLFQGQCNNGNSFQLASEPQGNINHGNQIQGSGNQGSPHHGHGNYASSFQVAPGSHGNSSPGNQSHGGGDLDHMAPGNGLQGNCYQGTIQIMPHAAMSQSGFEGMGTVLNIPSFQHRGLEAVGH